MIVRNFASLWKNIKAAILVVGLGLFVFPLSAPFSGHLPQVLLDTAYGEIESYQHRNCLERWRGDPNVSEICWDGTVSAPDEYVRCMKSYLHNNFSRQELENLVNFIRSEGYVPGDIYDDYNDEAYITLEMEGC